MYLNSPGIILKQTKIGAGRKMLTLFTKKYGKLSVGSASENKAKSRQMLAMGNYTYSNYQIFQGRSYYNVDKAETIHSFYKLSDPVDKFGYASYAIELTEKIIPENVPQPAIFDLLIDFMKEMEERPSKFETLLLAYEIKLLRILGLAPSLDVCTICGKEDAGNYFSVKSGGIICDDCFEKSQTEDQDRLIYKTEFDIVKIINYFLKAPLSAFRKVALSKEVSGRLQEIVKKYIEYYLDVRDLKSEYIFDNKF